MIFFFLQKAYKEVAKELIPTILFPSDSECKSAIEEYLARHAGTYIDTLGLNNWISKFEAKILPEVSKI